MVSAQELLDFAARHNLTFHPSKSLDEFVELVNSNGGACPCVAGRMCPCEEALDDIASASRPQESCCTCRSFVTADYLAAWGHDGDSPKKAPSSSPSEEVDPETVKVANQISTALGASLKLFDANKFEDAANELWGTVDSLDCELCKESLAVEAIRVGSVRDVCSISPDECKKDADRVRKNIIELQSFYSQVGGKPAKKTGKSNPYHDAMRDWLNSPELEQYAKKTKFFIATQLASGKVSSVEEGAAKCLEVHPDWVPYDLP